MNSNTTSPLPTSISNVPMPIETEAQRFDSLMLKLRAEITSLEDKLACLQQESIYAGDGEAAIFGETYMPAQGAEMSAGLEAILSSPYPLKITRVRTFVTADVPPVEVDPHAEWLRFLSLVEEIRAQQAALRRKVGVLNRRWHALNGKSIITPSDLDNVERQLDYIKAIQVSRTHELPRDLLHYWDYELTEQQLSKGPVNQSPPDFEMDP